MGLDDLLPYMTPEHAEASCLAAGRYAEAERFRLRIEVEEESLRADSEAEEGAAKVSHAQAELDALKQAIGERLDELDTLIRLGKRVSERAAMLDKLAELGALVA